MFSTTGDRGRQERLIQRRGATKVEVSIVLAVAAEVTSNARKLTHNNIIRNNNQLTKWQEETRHGVVGHREASKVR
jgi:hypothetical protein